MQRIKDTQWRTALMGFAALWIYIFHEWKLATGSGFIHQCLVLFKRLGFCGVDIFFLLSGIGLTYSYSKNQQILTFYSKRLKRLLPIFWSVGIIIALFDHWSLEQTLGNLLCYNFWTKSMYSFLWFVPAILFLYLIFPWYYKLFLIYQNKTYFLLVSLELWLIVAITFENIIRTDLYGMINRIPIFLVGIYLGYLLQHNGILVPHGAYILYIVSLCLGLQLAYLCNFKELIILVPVSNCLPNFILAITLFFLLSKAFNVIDNKRKKQSLLLMILEFYGNISLEFYCIQEWLYKKTEPLLTTYFTNRLLLNTVMLILCTITAYFFHVTIRFILSKFNRIEK